MWGSSLSACAATHERGFGLAPSAVALAVMGEVIAEGEDGEGGAAAIPVVAVGAVERRFGFAQVRHADGATVRRGLRSPGRSGVGAHGARLRCWSRQPWAY